ncbi:FxLYD domain-containing protein [Achromobacter aegrifaciens]
MTPKQTTINTVTLTCSTCGSAQFTKLDTNEYRCSHCHAVTLVEDNVAQRLEKILRGMQQPAPAPQLGPRALAAIAVAVAAVIAVPLVASLLGSKPATITRLLPAPPPIDASLVKLTDVQEIRVRDRTQLVMIMRNETGKKIDVPRVTASFFQGELSLPSNSGSAPARSLQPGEYTPITISTPSQAYSRYTLQVSQPSLARGKNNDVAASKVQLVRNDGAYRLVGLLKNNGANEANSSQITVMLYGEDGKLIGTGNGYGSASPLAPNALTSFDVRGEMLAEGQVAFYDYMVQSEDQAAAPKEEAPPSRIVRVSPADLRVIEHVRLTTQELLDPGFALFDASALKLSAPRRLLDEIERPVMYAELVNTSDQYVALSPKADISVFDGSRRLDVRQTWSLPARLYPGERVPVELSGRVDRYTEVKTDWLPAKRAALPGPRPKLAVTVENTEAQVGTGTLNFTYRFRYKYVTVHGRVRNDSQAEVENVRVWVSLYDAQDKLTGAVFQELRLPKLKPEESAPFQVNVKQYGGNFARVGVVYDAGPR